MAPSAGGYPGAGGREDPFAGVEDLDGTAHYRALGLLAPGGPGRAASAEAVRQAFRREARRHHPDKGGSAEAFERVTRAFEVLGDPEARAAYDAWARELEFRYVPGVAPQAEGGQDLMLDEFAKLGHDVDPTRQLVVICEVCRRPATTECWTCGMRICEFCTLKRHWKGKFGLHWPLVNAPGKMAEQLGRRELETKRMEDARRLALEDPRYRSERELADIRNYKEAAYHLLDRLGPKATAHYDLQLARHYMWAQTDDFAYLAVYIPNGFEDKEVYFEPTAHLCKIQAEDSPPLVNRLYAYPVATDEPVETFRTADQRYMTLAIPKAVKAERWARLFHGDPDGARCLRPPYELLDGEDEVLLQVTLPFWIEEGDVRVEFTPRALRVRVRNEVEFERTFWRNEQEEKTQGDDYRVIDLEESLWYLDDDLDAAGEAVKVLNVSMVRPPLTESEVKWKKGERQDNRNTPTRGIGSKKGFRFFADDADDFHLEDLLVALCFLETGASFVPRKPTDRGAVDKVVREVHLLPADVQAHLENFVDLAEEIHA